MPATTRPQVDPRGLRLSAAITSVVLGLVLLTGSGWLLLAQALVFAIGAGLGVGRSPYALLFRSLVRPRIGPPVETEDAAPPRTAQAVGLVFATVGTVALFAGAQTVGLVATAAALIAALLNATVGLCLGCELHLFLTRTRARLTRRTSSRGVTA